MVTPILKRVCPHCSSQKLNFLEHGSGVTVFQCWDCGRATVQRWESDRDPGKKGSDQEFVFPSWFTGVAER
jgi:predicted RNA-binding Zn-ribbon protein involved in translation (DUF1610 family)